jgi:hypothetical protein
MDEILSIRQSKLARELLCKVVLSLDKHLRARSCKGAFLREIISNFQDNSFNPWISELGFKREASSILNSEI